MCNRLRISQRVITPGLEAQYRILEGIRNGTWGINMGMHDLIFNARSENLHTSFWEPMTRDNRGILTVDSFFEKGYEFIKSDHSPMLLPVVFSMRNSFAVVTMESVGEPKKVHHRMPAIVDEQSAQEWLKQATIIPHPANIIINQMEAA